MHYAPLGLSLPSQGWKIHVSSCLEDVDTTLAAVWEYCVPRGLAFKFLRSEAVLVMMNSKAAFRGSSGKLVTIYPADESQLELVLKELDELLTGVPGRTSSAISATVTVPSSSGTAPSPNGTACRPPANGCWPSRTATAGSSRTPAGRCSPRLPG